MIFAPSLLARDQCRRPQLLPVIFRHIVLPGWCVQINPLHDNTCGAGVIYTERAAACLIHTCGATALIHRAQYAFFVTAPVFFLRACPLSSCNPKIHHKELAMFASSSTSKPLTVLIAPSGFKESLSAQDAANFIAKGVQRALPDCQVIKAPMADGGEGFTEALTDATGGQIFPQTVVGPVSKMVPSFFGVLGGRSECTGVIEMAAAAGLRLVPRDQRNPMLTTSYGVGELIRHALDRGCTRILLGCGDSGINDGGAGMAQALGARLLDCNGNEIARGGGALENLARIDLSNLDKRLRHTRLDAAVNWHNALLGERGVARVFGPQKGATPEQVELLEAGLQRYATHIAATTGVDVAGMSGAGASGGLGAGFAGLLGGTLYPRYDIVMQYLELDSLLQRADLVITAEGSIDGQTPFGKVPAEVASRAKKLGLPVIALAGTIGKGARANFDCGIDAFASILRRPCSLDEAIENAEKLLTRAAEDAIRMMSVGYELKQRSKTSAAMLRQEQFAA
jgi:glycerate 2-kinase